MSDQKKTKAQLIEELEASRGEVTDLRGENTDLREKVAAARRGSNLAISTRTRKSISSNRSFSR